jgi:hypothetical protein
MQSIVVPPPGRNRLVFLFENNEVHAGLPETRTNCQSGGPGTNNGNYYLFFQALPPLQNSAFDGKVSKDCGVWRRLQPLDCIVGPGAGDVARFVVLYRLPVQTADEAKSCSVSTRPMNDRSWPAARSHLFQVHIDQL